jgi:hypothetical protein
VFRRTLPFATEFIAQPQRSTAGEEVRLRLLETHVSVDVEAFPRCEQAPYHVLDRLNPQRSTANSARCAYLASPRRGSAAGPCHLGGVM